MVPVQSDRPALKSALKKTALLVAGVLSVPFLFIGIANLVNAVVNTPGAVEANIDPEIGFIAPMAVIIAYVFSLAFLIPGVVLLAVAVLGWMRLRKSKSE